MKLSDIATFVEEKVSSEDISLSQYVTTDSLLQNKAGRTVAQNLPPQKCSLNSFKKGDVLLGNIRPYLKKIWYATIDGGCSQDVLVLRAKENKDSSFLYALLSQDSFFEYEMKATKCSKMPRGDKNHIMNFPCIYLKNKIGIGSFLSTLDEKIALNRRINAKLEQMAKRLYDYWFVQFDFPNSDGKPYKSSGGKMAYNAELKRKIPEGWEVKSFSDFFELGNGKDYRHLQSGKIPVYGSGGFMCGITDFLFDGESVLFPRKGTLNNIMYKNEKFWTVDTMFYSKMKIQHSAIYVYYTAKKFDFSSLNTGTGVPSMTSVIIKGLPIIQPPQKIIDNFDCIVQSYYKKIHKNEQESARLTALRDKLLPLLMNGQVEVKKE